MLCGERQSLIFLVFGVWWWECDMRQNLKQAKAHVAGVRAEGL